MAFQCGVLQVISQAFLSKIDKFQEKAVCFGFLIKAVPVLTLLQASDNKLWRASQILPRSLWQNSSHPAKQVC